MNELSKFLAKETPLLVHKVSFPYPLKKFTPTILFPLSFIISSLSLELLHEHIVIFLNKTSQTPPTFSNYFSHFSPFIYSKALKKKLALCIDSNSSFHFGTEPTAMRFLHLELPKVYLWRSPMISKLLNPVAFQSSSYQTYLQDLQQLIIPSSFVYLRPQWLLLLRLLCWLSVSPASRAKSFDLFSIYL